MSGAVELYGIEYTPASAPWDYIAQRIRVNAEESLRELENSVRDRYLNDPLFHCQVALGARILDHLIPDLDLRDARRAALLVIARWTTGAKMIDYSAFAEAIAGMSQAFQNASKAMAKQRRRLQWELRILLADDAKERRRIRRDMAREYRRPALLHKGGKP